MSELNEQRWAVLSERGCEAHGLNYNDAHLLMRALVREKISGLCVITDDAAHRVARTEKHRFTQSQANGSKPKSSKH